MSTTETETQQMFWVIDPGYTTTEDDDHALPEGGRVDPTATSVGYVDSPAVWETPMIRVTASELEEYYNNQPFLQQQFGSYENYLGYQTAYSEAYDNFVGDKWGWLDIPEEIRDLHQEGYESFWGAAGDDEGLQRYTDYLNSLEQATGSDRVWTTEEAQLHMVSETVAGVSTHLGGIVGDIPVGEVTLPDGTTVDVGSVSLSEMGYDRMEGAPDEGSTTSWESQTAQGLWSQFHNSPEIQALNQQYGIDPNASQRVVGEDGNLWTVSWNGNGYTAYQYQDVPNSMRTGDYIQAAAIAGLTAGASSAIGAALGAGAGGAGGAAGGATGGASTGFGNVLQAFAEQALGNAIVQGAVTGDVDLSQVVTAGLTAGLGELTNMVADGALAAAGDAGAAVDNFAWDLADALGTDVGTVYDIASGAAAGAITGQDIEEIVLGAVGTYTTAELQNYVLNNFGDQFGDIEVENWFDEDTTTIDVRAFNPFIEEAVGAVLGDDITAEDALSALWEFGTYQGDPTTFDQGGTFAFADPTRADLGDLLPDSDLFSLGFIEDAIREAGSEFDDEVIQPIREALPHGITPDINIPDVDLPPVDIDTPDINVETPDIDVETPDVDTPDIDTPDIDTPDIDLPSVQAPQLAREPGGMFEITPFTSSYQTPIIQPLKTMAPEKDYTQELLALIQRNSSGRVG